MANSRMLLKGSGVLVNPATLRNRRSIKEAVSDIGGIGTLVYLVARAKSTCICLRLCHSLWKYDFLSTKEMLRIQGFELLGKFMRNNECVLDNEILQVVQQIVCTFVERKPGFDAVSFQNGVSKCGIVTNVEALKCLFLDWRIWQVCLLVLVFFCFFFYSFSFLSFLFFNPTQ